MVIFGFLAFFAVIGVVLYLPFFLWFRWRRPSGNGNGKYSAKVSFTPIGWAVLVAQLVALFAGFGMRDMLPQSDLARWVHGDAGMVKWWACMLVLFSVIGTLLRRAGIETKRADPVAEAETPETAAPEVVSTTPTPAPRRLMALLGVPIFVDPSYLFGGALFGVMSNDDLAGFAGYCVGFAALVAIHEIGHAVGARAVGLRVHGIHLSGIGGACMVTLPRRTRDAWLIYSAGLFAQVLVLASTLAANALLGPPASGFGTALVTTFTWVNAMLFLVNLLPGRTSRGTPTDGSVLWGLFKHRFMDAPHPFAVEHAASPLFDPATPLLTIPGLRPDGFACGIEMLNDDTTPMEFVVEMLHVHAGLDPDAAIAAMVQIHQRGGLLLPLPDRARADAVAAAVARDAHAREHRLVCRAVSADA